MRELRVLLCLKLAGVGGGDALLLSMVREAKTLTLAGVFVDFELDDDQIERARAHAGDPRLFIEHGTRDVIDKQLEDSLINSANAADVVISWSHTVIARRAGEISTPIVEVVQGTSQSLAGDIQQLARSADFFVGVSEATLSLVPEKYRSRATVINSGADIARVVPRKGRDAQRKQWEVGPDQRVLLTIGRLEQGKRTERLIEAIAQLPQDWIGIICGDGSRRESLEEQAASYARGRVGFVDPWVPIGDVLAAADCFLLQSDAEGDPIVLWEAHLAGVPVVASNLPVLDEHDRNAGRPLCVRVDTSADPVALNIGIRRAASADFAPTVAYAHRYAWERHTMQAIATKWELLIDEVVRRSRRELLSPTMMRLVGREPEVRTAASVERIRSSSTGKIRVVGLYDVEGWAYDHNLAEMAKYAPDDFDFSWMRASDFLKFPTHARNCDFVYAMPYAQAPKIRQLIEGIPESPILISIVNVAPDLNRNAVNWAIAASDVVFHNNDQSFRKFERVAGKHVYFPNGVALDVFRPEVKPADRPARVLWSGSKLYAEHKGHGILEEITPKLEQSGIEVDLNLVDSLGNIPRSRDQMAEWYQTGSVFVVASVSEGTPNPGLEAAASGCAIVSTRVGNMPSIVCPGKTGILVRRVPNAILNAIKVAHKNRETYATSMRERLESEGWGWDVRSAQFFDFVRRMATNQSLDDWKGPELPPDNTGVW